MGLRHCPQDPVVGGLSFGTQKVIADYLGRKLVTNHEWEFYDTIVSDIFNQWGTPNRDLFASYTNSKCNTYRSRGGLSTHCQDDALILCWSDQISYIFPLLPLLPRVLHKIK